MPLAFILINAETGSEGEVLRELMKLDCVREAHLVYGAYDIVAKIEAVATDKLKEVIALKVRRLNKVRSTLTMIVVDAT